MRLPVYDERKGAFARLRGEHVLVYWPHGFGDFVHFGYVAPLLAPENRYAITRYGDDFVHLYDGARGIVPLYSGVSATGDGEAQGARHLGIEWKKIRNGVEREVRFAPAFGEAVRAANVTALLYTDYPENQGNSAFPFHTKARMLLRELVAPERLAALDLARPLASVLRFDVPRPSLARIEARLRELVAPGERLYLLAPGGHTFPQKAWPASEAAAFADGLTAFDPQGRSLTVDEPTLRAHFGDLEVPFAHLLVALSAAAHAVVGVPAGPLHTALAMRRSAVVGIWLAHHPDWYDEAYAGALHLVGPHVLRKGYEKRKATVTTPPELRARTIAYRDGVPAARDVFEAFALLR